MACTSVSDGDQRIAFFGRRSKRSERAAPSDTLPGLVKSRFDTVLPQWRHRSELARVANWQCGQYTIRIGWIAVINVLFLAAIVRPRNTPQQHVEARAGPL
jgi:hypothetical protein